MFKTSCDNFFCGGFICDWGAVPFIWGGYTVPSKKGVLHVCGWLRVMRVDTSARAAECAGNRAHAR